MTTFEELMMDAEQLPDGPAKLSLLEEAAKIADEAGDTHQGYKARLEIVDAANWSGYPLKVIAAYSWMLGKYDQFPNEFDAFRLLWRYKWIISTVAGFPEVSRQQIEDMLADMRRRFLEHGYSERTYLSCEYSALLTLNEIEDAELIFKKFRQMDRDGLSDCLACEQNELVNHYNIMDEDELVIKYAEPILNGKMRCSRVPHLTYSMVMMPLYRLGRIEEALQYQKKGYRMIRGDISYIWGIANHLEFFAHLDLAKGLGIFEESIPLLSEVEDSESRMVYYTKSAFFMKKLVEADVPFMVKLPKALTDQQSFGSFTDLQKYLVNQALILAKLFDQRNGNSGNYEWLESLEIW